jgi:polyhydroxybutyrate depolymerase
MRPAARLLPVLAALCCALVLAGQAACAPAPASTPAPGSAAPTAAPAGLRTVAVQGRTALVHRGAGAAPGAPLVVVLHGAGGSAADMAATLGWSDLADRDGFVVVYPDGVERTWNGGTCCGAARARGVDDVGFLDALVAQVRGDEGTGPVYAVGFSNGAIMSYAWACARPGALAGIGPVAGAVLVDCPSPAPLRVVAVQGTVDDRVPIAGGRGPSGADFPGLDASLAPFRAAAGCPAAPETVVDGPARVSTWSCADGRQVVSDVVDGLGHAWPGAGAAAGTTDGPQDATGFLWAHLTG